MDKKIGKAWVKALRSGKYAQARGYLEKIDKKNKPRYCCLGVLQKCVLKLPILSTKETELSLKAQNMAKMSTSYGEYGRTRRDEDSPCLATLNDSGRNFLKIADIIEKHMDEL